MFPVREHMFLGEEHMFPVQKLMFSAQKHKLPFVSKTFSPSEDFLLFLHFSLNNKPVGQFLGIAGIEVDGDVLLADIELVAPL